MSCNPRVSVVVPMYNAQDHLAQCLDSVLSQTLRDLELICVDDGSSDGTCRLVEERAARDARVRLLQQGNAGPGAARNRALDEARGEYVYCLDADDFMRRNMLATCVGAMERSQADMALVAFRTYNQQCERSFRADWSVRNRDAFPSYRQGAFTWDAAPDLFFETVQNVPWNKVVRRSLLDRNNIRFQQIRLTEDLMYSLPAAVLARGVVRVDRPLMVHREFAGTNVMSDKGRHPLDFLEAFAALRSWLELEGLYDRLRLAYQTWLLDAVYYNMPTYRELDGFVAAYARLTTDDLCTFDLADLDPAKVRDHRHRALLEALRQGSREQFLLACANIEAAEVQEQKCGFQDAQSSLRWLAGTLLTRLLGR